MKPRIQRRTFDSQANLPLEWPAVVRRVLAARGINHESKSIVSGSKYLRAIILRSFDKPSDRILVVPAFGSMFGFCDIVLVISHLRSQI